MSNLTHFFRILAIQITDLQLKFYRDIVLLLLKDNP